MKPCSAYCEPEKGLHVFVAYCRTDKLDQQTTARVGAVRNLVDDPVSPTCVVGQARLLAIGHAVEVPLRTDAWPYPFLLTVQVLAS
jgi:hypothetical protein